MWFLGILSILFGACFCQKFIEFPLVMIEVISINQHTFSVRALLCV